MGVELVSSDNCYMFESELGLKLDMLAGMGVVIESVKFSTCFSSSTCTMYSALILFKKKDI